MNRLVIKVVNAFGLVDFAINTAENFINKQTSGWKTIQKNGNLQ
jgi:hypothetical protein